MKWEKYIYTCFLPFVYLWCPQDTCSSIFFRAVMVKKITLILKTPLRCSYNHMTPRPGALRKNSKFPDISGNTMPCLLVFEKKCHGSSNNRGIVMSCPAQLQREYRALCSHRGYFIPEQWPELDQHSWDHAERKQSAPGIKSGAFFFFTSFLCPPKGRGSSCAYTDSRPFAFAAYQLQRPGFAFFTWALPFICLFGIWAAEGLCF